MLNDIPPPHMVAAELSTMRHHSCAKMWGIIWWEIAVMLNNSYLLPLTNHQRVIAPKMEGFKYIFKKKLFDSSIKCFIHFVNCDILILSSTVKHLKMVVRSFSFLIRSWFCYSCFCLIKLTRRFYVIWPVFRSLLTMLSTCSLEAWYTHHPVMFMWTFSNTLLADTWGDKLVSGPL